VRALELRYAVMIVDIAGMHANAPFFVPFDRPT
jgi:hypothetical protein